MENWIVFWQCLLIFVFVIYYGVVLFIIPSGIKDIISLLRILHVDKKTPEHE